MRYFVYLSYDGGNYHGWQVQPNGTSVQEVNRLLNQFAQTRQMMKQLTGGRFKKKKGSRKGFFGF